jgi:hypothetical protein
VGEPIGTAMSIVRVRSTGVARIRLVILAAAISLMVPGGAAAKRSRHIARHHAWSMQAKNAQVALRRPTTSLGSMRYYGGPKCPMWREVNPRPVTLSQTASSGSMRYYGGPKSPMWRQ